MRDITGIKANVNISKKQKQQKLQYAVGYLAKYLTKATIRLDFLGKAYKLKLEKPVIKCEPHNLSWEFTTEQIEANLKDIEAYRTVLNVANYDAIATKRR